MLRSLSAAMVLGLAAGLVAPSHAVVVGEIDTFGTSIEGWFAGGGPVGGTPPTPPQVIATGGPDGNADAYLQVTSIGSFGPGGRLVAMNAEQWAGDYLAAGIPAIEMDLRNFGESDLTIRLYFEDPIPGPPMNEAVTSFAFTLAAGSDWTHVVFPIAASDLTVLSGDAETLLSNTTVLRIFHSPAATFPGEPVVGLLGIDNIHAIPEPQTLALMLAGMCAVAAAVRRRARG